MYEADELADGEEAEYPERDAGGETRESESADGEIRAEAPRALNQMVQRGPLVVPDASREDRLADESSARSDEDRHIVDRGEAPRAMRRERDHDEALEREMEARHGLAEPFALGGSATGRCDFHQAIAPLFPALIPAAIAASAAARSVDPAKRFAAFATSIAPAAQTAAQNARTSQSGRLARKRSSQPGSRRGGET